MWEKANEYFACIHFEKLWPDGNLRAKSPCIDSGERSQIRRHGRPMDGDSSSKFDRRYEKMTERGSNGNHQAKEHFSYELEERNTSVTAV